MKRNILILAIFCSMLFFVVAQTSSYNEKNKTSEEFQNTEDLPSGYGGITLGMSLDEVKEKLQKNREFGYNGDKDVSLLPGENRVLIETDPKKTRVSSFLDRCYFQFNEEKLYIIIINVNAEKMDHYSIFSKLCEKYGNPMSLSPEKSEWKSDSVTMTLERPLTLKYVDTKVFSDLNSASLVPPSPTEITRDMFLEGL